MLSVVNISSQYSSEIKVNSFVIFFVFLIILILIYNNMTFDYFISAKLTLTTINVNKKFFNQF